MGLFFQYQFLWFFGSQCFWTHLYQVSSVSLLKLLWCRLNRSVRLSWPTPGCKANFIRPFREQKWEKRVDRNRLNKTERFNEHGYPVIKHGTRRCNRIINYIFGRFTSKPRLTTGECVCVFVCVFFPGSKYEICLNRRRHITFDSPSDFRWSSVDHACPTS